MTFTIPAGREVLERTPGALTGMLSGLSESWISSREAEGSWSPRDVVAHLLGSEKHAWMPRIRHILEFGATPALTPFDREAEIRASAHRPIGDLLTEFAAERERSLLDLNALGITDAQLELTGTHPEFGLVRLRQLLSTWVVHDLSHTAQIVRVLGTQYQDDVGPWRANLRIVR